MRTRFLSIGAATVNLSQSQDANNALAAAINKHPSRFGGWATIPISDPTAAADELTRSVKELGFVGALINNHDQGKFYDNTTYWPFFARAQELNVPIYLHPAYPAREWTSRFQGSYPQSVAFSLGISGWDWRKCLLDLSYSPFTLIGWQNNFQKHRPSPHWRSISLPCLKSDLPASKYNADSQVS